MASTSGGDHNGKQINLDGKVYLKNIRTKKKIFEVSLVRTCESITLSLRARSKYYISSSLLLIFILTVPLALEDLVSVLKSILQDQSPVAIRQACISLKVTTSGLKFDLCDLLYYNSLASKLY